MGALWLDCGKSFSQLDNAINSIKCDPNVISNLRHLLKVTPRNLPIEKTLNRTMIDENHGASSTSHKKWKLLASEHNSDSESVISQAEANRLPFIQYFEDSMAHADFSDIDIAALTNDLTVNLLGLICSCISIYLLNN